MAELFNSNDDCKSNEQLINNNDINTYSLASRRSAFTPYRPSTLLTNLQRGNIQTQTITEPLNRSIHQLAALGELYLTNLDYKTVNEIDKNGLTPFLWAAANGQVQSLIILKNHGANFNFEGPNGENALLLAAANGYLQVIKLLLSWRININHTDDFGNSALMHAVFNNHTVCVKELLANGADITIENTFLETAHSVAVKQKLKEVQEILEKHTLELLLN